jgi:hypothetical protein
MKSCGFLVQDVHGGTADLKHEKPPDKFVIISVPGDHSRKPPLGRIQNLEVFSDMLLPIRSITHSSSHLPEGL